MRLDFIEKSGEMNRITQITIVFLLFLLIGGCSTDVDMYADYQDITIVYGVADVADDTTWIKVTKAFVGPGNAIVIAHNADSSNYPYKLNVQLIGKKSGSSELDPIVLDTMTIHNKKLTEYLIDDEGDTVVLHPFYAPNQLMYYTTQALNEEYIYTLKIDNKGKLIQGESPLIGNVTMKEPYNRISFPTNASIKDPSIKWLSVKNGKRYEVSLTFNYKELAPGSDTTYNQIKWSIGNKKSSDLLGGDNMEITYSGSTFFALLESQLPQIPNVKRWAGLVDIHIATGSQVLQTFLEINNSTGSLLEEVPVYSNLEGGVGIFGARHNNTKTLELSSITLGELVDDYDLGFLRTK